MPKREIGRNSVVVISSDQISANLAEEAAVLNLNSGTYYGLDPVGARIWRMIQQPQTVAAIHSVILAEYDVDANRCIADVLEFLEQLASDGLIDVGP